MLRRFCFAQNPLVERGLAFERCVDHPVRCASYTSVRTFSAWSRYAAGSFFGELSVLHSWRPCQRKDLRRNIRETAKKREAETSTDFRERDGSGITHNSAILDHAKTSLLQAELEGPRGIVENVLPWTEIQPPADRPIKRQLPPQRANPDWL
jgi:hypothetical protein